MELFILPVPFTLRFPDIPTPPKASKEPDENSVEAVVLETIKADEKVFAPAIVCAFVVIKPVEAAPA